MIMEKKRLTANEFVNEMKKAPEWAIDILLGSDDIELVVRENGEIKTYLSPVMIEMGDAEMKVFLAEVRKLSQNPSMQRNRLY